MSQYLIPFKLETLKTNPFYNYKSDYPERYEHKEDILICEECKEEYHKWISEYPSELLCVHCFRKFDKCEKIMLVAGSRSPTINQKDGFIEYICNIARDNFHCKILAILGREGFGCYNYGIRIKGGNWQKFAEAFTMAVFPSKYCLCEEKFEGFVLHDLKS
jgi:polyferredoxin